MATVQEPARATARADVVTIVIAIVGVSQILTGLVAFLLPGTFYDVVAGYPPYNEHFLMDVGSWQIALGALAVYGARRPDWRVGLLGLLALQYVLHLIPHLIHFDDAETSGQAWFATIALGATAALLIVLLVRERAR
jgi:hypothetical protein